MYLYLFKVNKNKLHGRVHIKTKVLGKWYIHEHKFVKTTSARMNIFCILYLVRENECVPTWRHHGRFLFVVDVMVLVRYGSLLVAKKRIVLFALYAHVSCMLVLWPKHVHCLVLKQKQEITQGNNFYVPPKII